MYTIIDWLFTLSTLVLTFLLPIHFNKLQYILIGIVGYLLYPILTEIIYNIIAIISFSHKKQKQHIQKLNQFNGIPILYNNDYNITACGIEKLHPFDSVKYRRVFENLVESNSIHPNMIYKPQKCSRGLMLSLGISKILKITKVVEVPLCLLPAAFLRSRLLDPMLNSTQGTLDAAQLALKYGWAINLGGGYHHASLNNGGGFCVYPDITLCIRYVRQYFQKLKTMVIDLDAHQGNGHERDSIGDPNTFIIDFYNHQIYPGDYEAKQGISWDEDVSFLNDSNYISLLKQSLEECYKQFQPEFVIYNAGTDCMENDPLGRMKLSSDAIILRDQLVLEFYIRRQIPIVMVLSGGYQQINAITIAASIRNFLLRNEQK